MKRNVQMKFDRATGLYKGNGKSIRAQLVGKSWQLLDIPQDREKTWMQGDTSIKIIFSISASECLSAAKAVEAWLKTRPFK
jgi:hypothetical protein